MDLQLFLSLSDFKKFFLRQSGCKSFKASRLFLELTGKEVGGDFGSASLFANKAVVNAVQKFNFAALENFFIT